MKKNILLNTQKVLTHVLMVTAIVIAIYGLGFMTNLYVLFYDGTMDTFEFYKTVQTLNKQIFNSGLIFIIFALLLKGYDLNKKYPSLPGMILVAIGAIYSTLRSISMLILIPQYAALYNNLDFSKMEDYVKSNFVFNLGTFLFIVWSVIAVLFLIICAMNFITNLKNNKLRSQSYE